MSDILEGIRRRQVEAAAERRDEFFATRTDIPDLEFLTPECPVCGEYTTTEDDGFLCDGCRIAWRRNGYGHEAERWEDE